MAFSFLTTGWWTEWLAPEVLSALTGQFLPFLFVPPLLITAACLWKSHRNAARLCSKAALVAFLIGIVWEMLVL